MQFNEAKVMAALQAKGLKPCAACGGTQVTVVPGYLTMSLSTDTTSINIGGNMVPMVGYSCESCGHMSLHAAAVLGVL